MDKEQAEQENNAYEDVISAQEDNQNSVEDAISALVNLGYQRLEAYKAVNKAAMKTQNADVSELIKLALKEFANKEI